MQLDMIWCTGVEACFINYSRAGWDRGHGVLDFLNTYIKITAIWYIDTRSMISITNDAYYFIHLCFGRL